MDLEIVGRAICSLPYIIYLKIRYGGRIGISWIQSFGRNSCVRIGKKAYLAIGKETITRGNTVFRAEKGILKIGNKCFFNTGCSITSMEEIIIGNGCQIANNVVIIDHDHGRGFNGFVTRPVYIGEGVWIGANSVILKGSVIGDGCIIAAGSVVRGKVEDHTMFYQKREDCVIERH